MASLFQSVDPHALLGSLVHGPVEFDSPAWLWLIPIGWGLVVWIGWKTIAGLSSWARRAAFVVRLIVVLLLALAMAEPRTRDEAEDLYVAIISDVSDSIPVVKKQTADSWIAAAVRAHRKGDDKVGVITTAEDAIAQRLPGKHNTGIERTYVGKTTATDLASAVNLALALRPNDAAYRIVLFSDGRETKGDLLAAAGLAKVQGVPIDVYPIGYRYDSEAIVEDIILPKTARMHETVNLRVRITGTTEIPGTIFLSRNGDQLDLDPDTASMGHHVLVKEGTNVFTVPVPLPRAGPQEFQARFEPDDPADDAIPHNNRAMGVTFVGSEGKVLILAPDLAEAQQLDVLLANSRIATEIRTPEEAPQTLTEFVGYDAVILQNVSAYAFSLSQMEAIRRYVHDIGGGLIMVGGPDSLGAGGWVGTPVEEALPVKLDPPEKRQMPRGALILVMHSIEMPQGVFFGKKTAEAAVDALTRLDLAGIIEYNPSRSRGMGGSWVHPLTELGDKVAIRQSINRLAFGDMPSFDPSLTLALAGMQNADAGQKLVIVISDGDPSLSRNLITKFKKNGITISSVGVNPHSAGDVATLKYMADQTGGNFYNISNKNISTIPEIFFKEAQTVRRPLIWEGDPFSPGIEPVISEPLVGINAVPPITGYVVMADRENSLAIVSMRGVENDPVAAHWQYGMGRTFVFASDVGTRWATMWPNWGQFQAFWEQHVRWVMRTSGDAKIRILTENDGTMTSVTVEALDPNGARLNFANMIGRVARPDGDSEDIEFVQTAPGLYQARFKSEAAGQYLMNIRYAAPDGEGGQIEGNAHASVSRPFADEFRALSDNAALLAQVADITGGKVLPASPQSPGADLWRRAGVEMPIATSPLWLWMAMIGIGMFLVDVAVRRVRIDLFAMGRSAVGAFKLTSDKAGQQMESLHDAREKAKRRMAEQGTAGEANAGQQDVPIAKPRDKKAAATKFEATEEQLKASRGGSILDESPTVEQPKRSKPDASDDEEGMSRLLKAKRRARDEFEE
jgi:uncharacterized membrane protein